MNTFLELASKWAVVASLILILIAAKVADLFMGERE